MVKEYKVAKHNSTVCGYPGRDFDWDKFCWDGSEVRIDRCWHPNCRHQHEEKAPLPWVDDGLIDPNCEYLHVPYGWAEQGAIYRVRPNPSMRAGKMYRGHRIKRMKAILKPDGWYWQLEFSEMPEGG